MNALYVLDTFCAAGGAGAGYYRAGLMPVGIEKDPLRARHYPFPVHVGDALVALRTLNAGGEIDFVPPEGRRLIKHKGRIVGLAGTIIRLGLHDIVLEHGSPPCQAYTRGNAGKVTDWPKLIPEVRELFIEPEMKDPVYLCGCMFDLSTIDDDGERIHLAGVGGRRVRRRTSRQARGEVRPQGRVRAPEQGRRRRAARDRAPHDLGRTLRVHPAGIHRAHRYAVHGAAGPRGGGVMAQQPADDEYEDTATCPECHQPHVHPMSTVGDRRHYRCHGCMWSWWRPTDREVT